MALLTPQEKAAKDANLKRMTALKEKYEDMARLVVNQARSEGIVITVGLVHNTPRSSGWHRPVVEARFARVAGEYPDSPDPKE